MSVRVLTPCVHGWAPASGADCGCPVTARYPDGTHRHVAVVRYDGVVVAGTGDGYGYAVKVCSCGMTSCHVPGFWLAWQHEPQIDRAIAGLRPSWGRALPEVRSEVQAVPS